MRDCGCAGAFLAWCAGTVVCRRDPDWDFKSGLYKGQSPLALIQSPYDRPTENPMKESVKKIVENADQ